MKLKLFFVFILCCFHLTIAKAEYNFTNITAAFRTFLNEDLGKVTGDQETSLEDYWHLSSFAVEKVIHEFENSKYQIVHVCNYDYEGKEVPSIPEEFYINNKGQKINLVVYGYYFLTSLGKTPLDNKNLIVNVSRDFITVYSQNQTLDEISFFLNEIRKYKILKNPYRNSILEVKNYKDWPPRSVIAFMQNVGNTDSTWPDLILDPITKGLAFENTEGFLTQIPFYEKLKLRAKKGILLAGPPGTGKSFVGEILANSILKGNLKGLASLYILSARHLQNSANIQLVYSSAKDFSPAVIFMEDIDLLGIKNRQNHTPGDFAEETRLNVLLNSMDGLIDSKYLLTIGTTNRPDYVDPALTRSMRLGQHLWFGLPAFDERRDFFNRFGKSHAVWEESLSDVWLAGISEGMSGSDIIEVIRLTKKEAYLANNWKGELLYLTKSYFLNAFEMIKNEHQIANFKNPPYNQPGPLNSQTPSQSLKNSILKLLEFEIKIGH